MKRFIALILVLVVCFGFSSCGNKKTTEDNTEINASNEGNKEGIDDSSIKISINDKIENENFVMTFKSVEILPEYEFKIGEYSSQRLFVEKGNNLILLHGHIKNTGKKEISSYAFGGNIVLNDGYELGRSSVTFEKSSSSSLGALDEADFVIHANISANLSEIYESAKFDIMFNNDLSSVSYVSYSDGRSGIKADNTYVLTVSKDSAVNDDGNNNSSATKEIKIGDVIETSDFDFKLEKVELTQEVKPKNTSSSYRSYTAESGKVYVHVAGVYTNKSKKDVCIRDLFVPIADYDNGYKYDGQAITEDGDDDFTWVDSYVVCTPLESCNYHGLIECPEVVETSDKSLVVYFELDDDTYSYAIR